MKNYFLVILVFAGYLANAQKKKSIEAEKKVSIELNQGFIHGALGFEISPDDKKVVVWSKSNLLKIYSIKTGELLRTLSGHNSFLICATYHPYTGRLFSLDLNHVLIEWDSLGNPIKKINIKKIKSDNLLENYDQVRFAMLFTKDAKHLLLFDRDQIDYTYDILTGKTIESGSVLECLIKLKQIPDSLDGFDLMNPHLYSRLPVSSYQELEKFPAIKLNDPLLKTEYHFINSIGLYHQKYWNSSKYVVPATNDEAFKNVNRKYYSMSTGSTFSNLLFFDENNQLIQNINLIRNIDFPLINNYSKKPLLALANDSTIHVIDLSRLRISKTNTFKHGHYSDYIPEFDSSGNFVMFPFIKQKYYDNLDIATCECSDYGLYYNRQRLYGSLWNYGENSFSDSIIGRKFISDCPVQCDFLPTSKSAKKIFGEFPQDKHTKKCFEAVDGGIASIIGGMMEEYWAMRKVFPFNTHQEYLTFDLSSNLYIMNLNNGKEKKSFNNEVIPIFNAFTPDDKFVYTLGADGVVRFFDRKSSFNEPFARLISSDKGLLFLTRERFYMMHGQLSDEIYFNVDNKNYPFEQFDIKFNRPDKVLELFGCTDTLLISSYRKAYYKRLKKMGFTEDMLKSDFHIPEVTITNRGELNSVITDSTLNLKLSCKDGKYPLDRINVWINNVPVFGINGINLRDQQLYSLNHSLNLLLVPGINKIQVSVLNQAGAESYKETFTTTYKPTEVHSNLYLVTIGTSHYRDSRYDLTYAAKDATDIVKTFRQHADLCFEHIYSFSLTNEQVTKENVHELKKNLLPAQRNDVVILTIAGHGVLDKDLNYYLATYDMDFTDPSKRGLPYEELENLLDGIAPLKKVLLIDACNSGEIDKDEVQQLAVMNEKQGSVKFRSTGAGIQKKTMGLKSTSELMGELFKDLRKGTGTTVISSSGGAEYSMESDEWKNGLFTYCLLNGLTNKAADTNYDGQIMMSELQDYIRREVVIQSNGQQQPTSRMQNVSMDFRIW